jgi:hypothetical protein
MGDAVMVFAPAAPACGHLDAVSVLTERVQFTPFKADR